MSDFNVISGSSKISYSKIMTRVDVQASVGDEINCISFNMGDHNGRQTDGNPIRI